MDIYFAGIVLLLLLLLLLNVYGWMDEMFAFTRLLCHVSALFTYRTCSAYHTLPARFLCLLT